MVYDYSIFLHGVYIHVAYLHAFNIRYILCFIAHAFANIYIYIYIYIWLLVSTILKNMSQVRQWVSDDIPYMEHIKTMFETSNQQ